MSNGLKRPKHRNIDISKHREEKVEFETKMLKHGHENVTTSKSQNVPSLPASVPEKNKTKVRYQKSRFRI